MYPTVVMLLIETQLSMTNICEISEISPSNATAPVASEARRKSLGPVSFTVRPVYSTTADETESQRSSTLQSQGGQEYGLDEVIFGVQESQVDTTIPSASTPYPSNSPS